MLDFGTRPTRPRGLTPEGKAIEVSAASKGAEEAYLHASRDAVIARVSASALHASAVTPSGYCVPMEETSREVDAIMIPGELYARAWLRRLCVDELAARLRPPVVAR